MFQNIGVWDWIIMLVIVLVLFGGKKLPELSRSLGKSISAFKKGIKEGEDELKKGLEDKDKN
ncbi:MAG: twin-arginine translocase TatA/TatE family subunit [Elusimicrobia bacterium]|nr:twin-arginine translocase TatA/TatE family subunit [Elusimicrobiota bacterium]